MFEVVSELVAEGWLKAIERWKNARGAPVRFGSDSPPSALNGEIAEGPVAALLTIPSVDACGAGKAGSGSPELDAAKGSS